MRPSAFLLLVSFAARAATADPPPVLTLADALRAAAAGSPASVTAALDLGAAQEGTRRAKAAYWPSLSVSGNWQARDNEIVAIFGAFEVPTTQKNFFTAEASLTELLWDGGRRSAAVAASRGAEEAASSRARADVQAAQLEALATYLRALAFRARRSVVTQRITSLEEHLRVARDLYAQGLVARNDLLGTEVRLRTVRDQVAQVDDGFAVALQSLRRLLGLAADAPLTLPETLPPPPPLPDGLDGLRKRAAASNPRLAALRAGLGVDRASVDARKGESWPSVFAQLAHTYQQNEYLAFPNANVFYVGATWQIWENGARRAAVRQAELAARRAETEVADFARALDIRVDETWRDFEQARRETATARTNVAAAAENLRIVEDQYGAGLARTLDVLDAEEVLAESRFALVNQTFTAYLKEGALAAAAGLDLPAFFAAAPAPEDR